MANKYLFCLVAFLCCTGLSFARDVKNDCSQGPSVWCQSLSTSMQCHATHHCASNVWNKMLLPLNGDFVCDICTTVIQEARNVMANKNIQEAVKKVLELPCHLLPIPVVPEACVELVDTFVPEVMKILASAMSPQQVCSIIMLCKTA